MEGTIYPKFSTGRYSNPDSPRAFPVSMGKYKRRSVGSAGEDRFSNLPAHLIDSILDWAPFEDAVKTSILSKSWRYRWTTMKTMTFNHDFIEKFTKNGVFDSKGYISTINQMLSLHKGPISKFVVYIPNLHLDSFQEIHQWMLYISRNGVKELVLTNSNQRYELPSHVFSYLGLTELVIENFFFNPPLEFEGFLNLEELFLEHIDFGTNVCGTQINLPQLKNLSLLECVNVRNFNVKVKELKSLIVVTCPDAKLLQLLENPSLICFGISFRTMEDFGGVERISSVTLLSSLTRIEDFLIEGNFLKFLFAEKVPKWLPLSLNSLTRLVLQDFQLGDWDQLQGALCLIRNSPNLGTLRIHLEESRVDVGPVLSHLEAPNCLDYPLKQLKTVEITCVEGSKLEMLFIKLLLAHSRYLEKMNITPNGYLNIRKRFSIAKDVMRFPRASPKEEMIYLNPEP